ncbi:MAG: iron-regulated protein [Hymenobacteraceae bacterium]|nr:iron-regulated protein [Hymenobacteraceae bacterium]
MALTLPRFSHLLTTALLGLALLPFAGCKDAIDDSGLDIPPTSALAGSKKAAVTTYAEVAFATYDDALIAARALDAKARAFVAAPTAAGLDDLRAAWKAARVPYNQTDAFRFYGGPIDNASTGVESLLNAWPMEESFLDYTVGNPALGLINNPAALPIIDKSSVEALNEQGGETNISCGYHAVEFLLWGQDLSATGPGARPFTDYSTAPNATRRGQYLTACTALIVDHLGPVRDAWAPGGAYRTAFTTTMPSDSALTKLLTGLGRLSKGELAGERMQVALDNQDQEDEHSCFSDNTDQDLKGNEQGIVNVITGTYTRTNGTQIKGASLADAVKTADAAKGGSLLAAATQAKTAVDAIQAPFDQEIIGADSAPGRQRVRTAVTSCRAQADQIVAAARALDITLVL